MNHTKIGSQPPEGYIAWHEWAEAQMKGGLKSKRCKHKRYLFPQERCQTAHPKLCK